MSCISRHHTRFTQQEIKALFKKAYRAYKGDGLDILIAPTHHCCGRILVVTPRKVGTAPERNKIRRRIKAIFHTEQLYKKRIDCFVIIKKMGTLYDYTRLKKIIEAVFNQVQ